MKRILCGAAVVLSLVLSVWAQAPGTVAKIYVVKPKSGMEAQFEEAYKSHIDWHRSQNDTWVWDAWQFETGPRVGQYAVVTPGHRWSDFDERGEMGKADEEQAQQNLYPLMDSVEVWFSRAMPEISRMPEDVSDVAVARVTDYYVRPGKDIHFMGLLRKVSKAMADSERDGALIWEQNLTGPGGVYTLVNMYPDWASLAPPEKSMIDTLVGKLGAMETAELVEAFSECVERTESQLVRYRKDLSYHPQP